MIPENAQCSKIIYFIVLLTCAIVSSEDANMTIPLNKTMVLNNSEMYGDFITIGSNSTMRVSLTMINKKVDFVVFQVHSHLYNITVYNNSLSEGSYIAGRNIGLFGLVKPSPDTYYILNNNGFELKLYISIHGYRDVDPVPGGCNMELPTFVAPYLQLSYTKDLISIGAAGQRDPKSMVCPSYGGLHFYRMYMVERDFDENSYFEGIRKMITWDKIQQNGVEVPQTMIYGFMNRLLSAYPGTGSVYVAVAMNRTGRAIYVPTLSYACSPIDGCYILDDIMSQLFCASLLFVGLFVCFLGHRFFKTEMFLVGMFTGIIATYTLIPLCADLERPALLGVSIMSGVFFGAIWLLLWWFYGIPVLSVCLATMKLGFLLSSIIYFKAEGFAFFESDGNFWVVFVLFMVLTSVILSTVAYVSNILSCAVLGAYAAVFAIDYYMGSNLKYIIINTMRRAVVKNFNKAVLSPPFQWRDTVATLLWIFLAVSGFVFQHIHNRGRPPFPAPPRSLSLPSEPIIGYGSVEGGRQRYRIENPTDPSIDERTPLISDA